MAFAHVKKVAIIGGGVAGLNTARALSARGIQCTIFEKEADVGGVWRSNYSGYGVQVPRNLYEFLDFPFSTVKEWDFPSGAQVQAYIQAFKAKHVDGVATTRVGSGVISLAPRTDGARGWSVSTATDKDLPFDYAVLCTGLYSTPFVPAIKAEGSAAQVVHSTAFTSAEAAKGKHVVVLGGCKSALDCAVAAANAGAASTTLLSRKAHWGTPRKIAGVLPFQFVFLSRFGQALVSWFKGALPGAPSSVQAVHSAIAPIMRPVFGLVEALFAFQLGLRGVRSPSLDVVADFYGYAQVLDSSFQQAVAAGKIRVVAGEAACLASDGLHLAGAAPGAPALPCDLVVAGTGFQADLSFLPPATQAALAAGAGGGQDGLYLYRHTLPVAVPDLAFVGSAVATISNIATHGLQAEWLARLLAGKHALPGAPAMAEAVAAQAAWARGWMPSTPSRASLVLLHQTHYHDQLCKDMGVAHRRKGGLGEIFWPYRPSDYNGIVGK